MHLQTRLMLGCLVAAALCAASGFAHGQETEEAPPQEAQPAQQPASPDAAPPAAETTSDVDPLAGGPPATPETEPVTVRAWAHDDFGRIVFDWPADVAYEASITDQTLTVAFDRPLETTFTQIWRHLEAYVADVSLAPDGRTVLASLTGDYGLRTRVLHDAELTRVVLDILDHADPAAVEYAEEATSPVTVEAEAASDPSEPSPAHAESVGLAAAEPVPHEASADAALAERAPDLPSDSAPAEHAQTAQAQLEPSPLPAPVEAAPVPVEHAPEPPSEPTPADAVPVVAEQAPPSLSIPVAQSRMLRLDAPAASVFVANPDIADVQLVSSGVVFVIGKAIGRTSVAALDTDSNLIAEWTVSTVVDVEPARAALAGATSLRDVHVRQISRGVELGGNVASVAEAGLALRLVTTSLPEGVPVENRISVSGAQQVTLEVQIAEVQRTVSESLGLNWEVLAVTGGQNEFGVRVGRLLTDALLPGIFPSGRASSIFGSHTLESGQTKIRGLIDALATAGLATVLARPSVTAVSGETASFFSGGEYPLPAGFEDGAIIFEYKKFGVLLDFVPTVVDNGRIVLTVRPEVSQRSETDSLTVVGVEIPVINVRRAETTVEVGNGESIVIAGLYRDQSEAVESGVPVLKDVPLLNLLFGSQTVRSNATELIVVVTARLSGAAPMPRTTARSRAPSGLRLRGYHF